MEFRFLVDVNLPKYFHYFNNENFVHVLDINPTLTDQEIWDYALKNNLVILTKDTDFYNRFMSSELSLKIVYFSTWKSNSKGITCLLSG
jgi:predicted nuclease of predicted toxin-antitoxin system